MNFTISYAITACNEHLELDKLIKFVNKYKRSEDEIIVQVDSNSVTEKVLNVIKKNKLKVNKFNLNNDFASFKNNLKRICKGDYIFQIDADEIPAEETVSNLHKLIESNLDIDLFLVPRINIVEGLTKDHIERWNWTCNEKGWINWPDYQYRIFKNNFNIKWENKVHEVIKGVSSGSRLPSTPEYALLHIKSIKKQENQNKFYENLTE